MYRVIKECRACGSREDLQAVFSLGVQPLANDFCLPSEARAGFAPLDVMFCSKCTLAQLSVAVDPAVLYSKYLYVTSNSDTMQRHFQRLSKDVLSEAGCGSLLEIGSNDGTYLRFAQERGFGPVIGIDPAANLRNDPKLQIVGLFDKNTAAMAKQELGKIDVIMARHVFCHIDDWRGFINLLNEISHDKTLICIEVPYVGDLLRKVEFDTIYHEHTSYLSLKALVALLKSSPFHIHRVSRYGVHGGSLLIMLRHNDSGVRETLDADEFIAEEQITSETWDEFKLKAETKIDRIRTVVLGLAANYDISCFGASAKSTVLLNACGFDHNTIKFITDNSPLKPGRFSPGSNIPVIPEDEMLSMHPDYSIMTAWNYAAEIAGKNRRWLERGGKFILPNEKVEYIHNQLEKVPA